MTVGFLVNFVAENPDNPCQESSDPCYWEQPFHGTALVSIAQAFQNDTLVVGVTPGARYAFGLKTVYWSGGTRAPLAAMAEAIEWATQHWNSWFCLFGCIQFNIRVGTVGYGYSSDADPALFQPIQAALDAARTAGNVLWVGASGLYQFIGTDGILYDGPWYPASLNNIISVSALDSAGTRSGPKRTDLMGPHRLPVAVNRLHGEHGFQDVFGGTSAAAPHVSGVAALVLERNPDMTASQLESCLLATASPIGGPGWNEDFGWGMVNAIEAVQCGGGSGGPPLPDP